MSDEPKSAVELAMERLRKKDAADGVVEPSLTDDQKKAIAEARSISEARLAEVQIMHRSKTIGVFDPELLEKLNEEHRRDIRQITGDRDRAIERIRSGA
jgi:hypothetical protein